MEMGGVEPPTCALRTHRSDHLSYIPICRNHNIAFPPAATKKSVKCKPPRRVSEANPVHPVILSKFPPSAHAAFCPLKIGGTQR